MLRILLCF